MAYLMLGLLDACLLTETLVTSTAEAADMQRPITGAAGRLKLRKDLCIMIFKYSLLYERSKRDQ
jgi:hypothetical protein